MKKRSLEEIMRRRAEGRRTQKQGIDFLREYREHPDQYLPLIDHQYRHFDAWQDEESRNLGWDAGIFQDSCPYFAECWKIYTTTVLTVFICRKGIPWKPDLKNILVEFIRNGLIAGLSGDGLPQIETRLFTDGTGTEFCSFNLILSEDGQGQLIHWGRGHFRYEELNRYNGQKG